MSKAITPTIRRAIANLMQDDTEVLETLLPLVTSYIANPLNNTEITEGYPFTFSKIMTLNKLDKSHRNRTFRKFVPFFEDKSTVIRFRKTYGRKASEIWFTPLGFWAAFDELRTSFSKKVRTLKNRIFDLAMRNLARRTKEVIEKNKFSPYKVLALEMDMAEMINTNTAEQKRIYTYPQRKEFWRKWREMKMTGTIKKSGDDERSSFVSTVSENEFINRIYRF